MKGWEREIIYYGQTEDGWDGSGNHVGGRYDRLREYGQKCLELDGHFGRVVQTQCSGIFLESSKAILMRNPSNKHY